MRSEKSKKGSKNNKAKRNVQTVEKAPRRQSKEEIISEEELENRIAIRKHRFKMVGAFSYAQAQKFM